MASLPLSRGNQPEQTALMTPLVLFILFLLGLGVAGNLGWIKPNTDPDHPEPPFIRHS